MSYLDNDDDLFDYDPELDQSSSASVSQELFTKSSESSDFQNFVSKNKSDDDIDLSSNQLIDQHKVKLALAFHSATHRHFSGVESPTYFKAITLVLDKLTDGHFSLIYMFYRKEALIAQRLLFLSMMDAVTNFSEKDSQNILSEILSHLGITIDKLHVDLNYGTSLSICRHAVATDRVIYQHLSDKLSIPVNEFIIDPHYNYAENPSAIADIINSDIYTKIFSSITIALAEEGILEKLQETFGTKVTLFNNV